jgi:hypothetical protein
VDLTRIGEGFVDHPQRAAPTHSGRVKAVGEIGRQLVERHGAVDVSLGALRTPDDPFGGDLLVGGDLLDQFDLSS